MMFSAAQILYCYQVPSLPCSSNIVHLFRL